MHMACILTHSGHATLPDGSPVAVPCPQGSKLRERRISDCTAHLCIPRSRRAPGVWPVPNKSLMEKGRAPSLKEERDRLRAAGRTQPATGTSHGLLGALTAVAEHVHTCGRSLGSKSLPVRLELPHTGLPVDSLQNPPYDFFSTFWARGAQTVVCRRGQRECPHLHSYQLQVSMGHLSPQKGPSPEPSHHLLVISC